MTVPIPGPDPEPTTPELPTPAHACDSHAHIFGPSDRFPYAEGRGYTPPDAPVEHYLAMLDTLGIERGVCVQGNAHGYDNGAILDAIRRYPARLRAVGITDDRVGPETLREWHAMGMRGLRFHLFHPDHRPNYVRGVGLEVFERFRATMTELGWHMQVWCDWRQLDELVPIFQDITRDLPIVIDHMLNVEAARGVSQPAVQTLLRLLGDGSCWVKVSGTYRVSQEYPDYPDARPLHEALVRTNPDQLVWGSDWPHPQMTVESMPNDGHLLDLFNAWTPDEATRRRILVDNPARLYDFPRA
jgi:predicted TIM-barrel fold metal-dependent hydrolase